MNGLGNCFSRLTAAPSKELPTQTAATMKHCYDYSALWQPINRGQNRDLLSCSRIAEGGRPSLLEASTLPVLRRCKSSWSEHFTASEGMFHRNLALILCLWACMCTYSTANLGEMLLS